MRVTVTTISLSLSRCCHVKFTGSVTQPAQPGQIALITPDTLTRENSGQSYLSNNKRLHGFRVSGFFSVCDTCD